MKHAVLPRGRLPVALMVLIAAAFAATAMSGPASADMAPAITGVAPAYGAPAGGTQVTLSGSGFTGAVSVTFGTAPALFTVASDTQITATSPPGTGTVPVTVTTPSGSASAQFIYTPIQHVVVIYEENHSFDSLLGYWCQDIASGSVTRAMGCTDAASNYVGMPASVTLSDGAVVTPGVSPDTVPQLDHSVTAQVVAMDGGQMDGWQSMPDHSCSATTGYACVAGYEPSQVVNLTALAQNFAISDETFSMADSPSWGGHVYAVAGTLDGFLGSNPSQVKNLTPGPGWGCDSDKVTHWQQPGGTVINVPSCVPDPSLPLANGGAFRPTPVPQVPTIMDRLGTAGLSWRIYGAKAGQGGYQWATCPTFAGCLDTSQATNVVSATRFTTDAAAGVLPAFSLVTPGGKNRVTLNSCHNGTSITACDNWIGSLVQAVENGPDWGSTAIFITFDDFGGFYDQVPPGINPDGTQQGPRSPLIIVSPYARPGFTDSTPTTFAGLLAFVEQNFGLSPLAQNDAAAYPFTNAFDYTQTPLKPVHMVTRPLPASAKRITLAQATTGDS